jgi:hypothetical protein
MSIQRSEMMRGGIGQAVGAGGDGNCEYDYIYGPRLGRRELERPLWPQSLYIARFEVYSVQRIPWHGAAWTDERRWTRRRHGRAEKGRDGVGPADLMRGRMTMTRTRKGGCSGAEEMD